MVLAKSVPLPKIMAVELNGQAPDRIGDGIQKKIAAILLGSAGIMKVAKY